MFNANFFFLSRSSAETKNRLWWNKFAAVAAAKTMIETLICNLKGTSKNYIMLILRKTNYRQHNHILFFKGYHSFIS